MRILLAAGADVSLRHVDGWNALSYAFQIVTTTYARNTVWVNTPQGLQPKKMPATISVTLPAEYAEIAEYLFTAGAEPEGEAQIMFAKAVKENQ